MSKKLTDNQYLKLWEEFRLNIVNATPIDLSETEADKLKRVKKLEENPEEWFKYYFPNFYTSEPAPFHLEATKRVLNSPEHYEVRAWSRELAKSARTMMEVIYLTTLGKKQNVILVSDSADNAKRLLLPYKTTFESNNRLIHDYGSFENYGHWEAGEFVTSKGVSFRGLGAGQSPRGTRNNAIRPDVILIDDIDTDEECRNLEIIDKKIEWIEQALIPTRSISNHLLIIVCGNIIAEYCCVTELAKKADFVDIINIVDKHGFSSWAKNSQQDIERIKKTISYDSFNKEYMNTPMSKGKVFKELTWASAMPLNKYDSVIIYADPSPSNKTKSVASNKAIVIIGKKANRFFVHYCWVDTMSTAQFIDALFQAYLMCKNEGVDPIYCYIENNSLQDPFYTQVIQPEIFKRNQELGISLPIREDTRKKPDKFTRIEGTLEPLNRLGSLIFNSEQKTNPHFLRLEKQMLAVSSTAKLMDGPDAIEGGVYILQNFNRASSTSIVVGPKPNRRY